MADVRLIPKAAEGTTAPRSSAHALIEKITAGEQLDEIRTLLAVLDRAYDLAGMVDTLADFGVYAQADASHLVTLFQSHSPKAPYVFRLWASSHDLAIMESPAKDHTLGTNTMRLPASLHAYRPHANGFSKRYIASLHLDAEVES